MRCDRIDKSAYTEPDSGVEIVFFKQGMESVWAEVQKGAGEFADCTEEEIVSYFTKRFGTAQQELERRYIFLKEKKTGVYIGTCIAWFEPKGEEIVPVAISSDKNSTNSSNNQNNFLVEIDVINFSNFLSTIQYLQQ